MKNYKIIISMTVAVACLAAKCDDEYDKQMRLRNIISVRHYDEERNDCHWWQTELADKPKFTVDEIARINQEAENGSQDAQCEKGILTYWGIGTDKDVKKAYESFERLGKNKHARSLKCLSECCYLGIGTSCDEKFAFLSWLLSAKKGYMPAMLSFGDHCKLRCIKDGWCKKRKGGCDETDQYCPLKWYKLAAEKGNLTAKLAIADVYAPTDSHYIGGGVEDYGHKNLPAALKILKELAVSKDVRIRAKANCKMGEVAYNLGDRKKALAYYDKSDAEGCEQARRNMPQVESKLYDADTIVQRQFERVKTWNENREIIRYTEGDVRPIIEASKHAGTRKTWRGFYVGMPVLDAVVLARFYNPQALISLTKDLEVIVEAPGVSVRSKWLCRCERSGKAIEVKELNDHPDFVKCLFPKENTDQFGLRSDARMAANAFFDFCMDKKFSKLKKDKIWQERFEGKMIRLNGKVVDVESGFAVVDGTAAITNLLPAASGGEEYNDGGVTASRIANAKRELDRARGRLKEYEDEYENDKRHMKDGKIQIDYKGEKKLLTLKEYYLGLEKDFWGNAMPEDVIAKARKEVEEWEKKYNAFRGVVDVSDVKVIYRVWFEGKAVNDRLAELNKGDVIEFEAYPSMLSMSRPDGKAVTYTADMRKADLLDGK